MKDFQSRLINWYSLNKRDLPWRHTKDPYLIWLSEIILQQTRVDQGKSYFNKFSKHYPTVYDLAQATEENVLNDWQGLGYYSRARNLHATAQKVVKELNGKFPKTHAELIKLKGIGEYTASAISSFSSNEIHAVVDGNVYRVLSRIFDISTAIDSNEGKREFKTLAQSLILKNNPGEFNQAIMEFGATHCTPYTPNCHSCPFIEDCLSFRNHNILERPVKSKKTKQRNRYFYFLILQNQSGIILEKRTSKDIWQHLYQFPLIETDSHLSEESLREKVISLSANNQMYISDEIVHILSHQKLHCKFIHIVNFTGTAKDNQIVTKNINDYPLPRVIDRYLEKSTFGLFNATIN